MTGHLSAYPSALFEPMTPAGFRLLASLDNTAKLLGLSLAVTCGSDGHGPDDPHTRGLAYDVSLRGLTPGQILDVLESLQALLPRKEFTILLESPVPFSDPRLVAVQFLNPHATGPHLHLQLRKGLSVWPVPPSERPSLSLEQTA